MAAKKKYTYKADDGKEIKEVEMPNAIESEEEKAERKAKLSAIAFSVELNSKSTKTFAQLVAGRKGQKSYSEILNARKSNIKSISVKNI